MSRRLGMACGVERRALRIRSVHQHNKSYSTRFVSHHDGHTDSCEITLSGVRCLLLVSDQPLSPPWPQYLSWLISWPGFVAVTRCSIHHITSVNVCGNWQSRSRPGEQSNKQGACCKLYLLFPPAISHATARLLGQYLWFIQLHA